MPFTRTLLLLATATPLVSAPVSAQDATPPRGTVQRSWSGSVGISRVSEPYGLGMHANVITRRQNRALRLGIDQVSNLKSTRTLNALSLTVGSEWAPGAWSLGAFAGPALVWGEDQRSVSGPPENARPADRFMTAGLAAEVTALLGGGRSRVRFGVGGMLNANPRETVFGGGPRLQIVVR